MVEQPRLVVSVAPDTARFAEVLRVFARHVASAADEIENLTPNHAREETDRDVVE